MDNKNMLSDEDLVKVVGGIMESSKSEVLARAFSAAKSYYANKAKEIEVYEISAQFLRLAGTCKAVNVDDEIDLQNTLEKLHRIAEIDVPSEYRRIARIPIISIEMEINREYY